MKNAKTEYQIQALFPLSETDKALRIKENWQPIYTSTAEKWREDLKRERFAEPDDTFRAVKIVTYEPEITLLG